MSGDAGLRDADLYCRRLLRHYENFTVASKLAPRHVRRHLTRIYAFCRTTDDLGDETGDREQALQLLTAWRERVSATFDEITQRDPVLRALSATVRECSLDRTPFLDLIDANLQDQSVSSYADWAALHGYCVRSAAPVGRMVLRVFGVDDERALSLSDDVCIGLQLANFVQDVSVDASRGRVYLLQEDVRRLGEVGATRAMAQRARTLLQSGRELEGMVGGRLRLQLALYRCGGEAILDAVAACGHDTRRRRPVVTSTARLRVLRRALAASLSVGRSRSGAVPVARNG
ncbi:MAG: squalene synthase HpnC [Candidatus Dormibacteraeota bacterium]|nr:squalene synthase HpnC [Candidatus Dormibacteraeota bacterium]